MKVVRWIRARKLSPLVAQRLASYRVPAGAACTTDQWSWSREDRHAWQLDAINRLWAGWTQRIPYYRGLVERGICPPRFESLAQFMRTVPLGSKDIYRKPEDGPHGSIVDPSRPADYERITGGSTNEPLRLPSWSSEPAWMLSERWLARAWWGVAPTARVFAMWGHTHAMGTGLAGFKKKFKRKASDVLLGQTRINAYDIRPSNIAQVADKILAFGPNLLVGYSGTLTLLCRLCEHRAEEFRRCGITAALASAEMFPSEDSPDIVRRVLGCPVFMEYGTVETDAIGQHAPDLATPTGLGGYRAFWQSYFIELGPASPTGGRPLYVTSLYERKTPLVRYDVGDELVLYPGQEDYALATFRAVLGRTNSMLKLPTGDDLHVIGLKHCVEQRQEVLAFQIVEGPEHYLELRVVMRPGATEAQRAEVQAYARQRMNVLNEKGLAHCKIVFGDALHQTPAGKTPLLYRLRPGQRPDQIARAEAAGGISG